MDLETGRLRLRNFTAGDLEALWDIFRDEETMEHMAAMTFDGTRELLRTFCLERETPGAYAIQRKADGAVIGWLLFNQVDAPGIYELGWVLRRDCWRQGFAEESDRAVLEDAFVTRKAHKVVAETQDVRRTVPLLESLGMKREGIFRCHSLSRDGSWRDLYWYGLLAEDRRD